MEKCRSDSCSKVVAQLNFILAFWQRVFARNHARGRGFQIPAWRDLAEGLRPRSLEDGERTVGVLVAWQHETREAVERFVIQGPN